MFLVERNISTFNDNAEEKTFPEQDALAFPNKKRIIILYSVSTVYEGHVNRTRTCICARFVKIKALYLYLALIFIRNSCIKFLL